MKRIIMATLLLAAVTTLRAETKFGAADWLPSPTDPVGFAGQGNNWYPGANPPAEFWEGAPTNVTVRTRLVGNLRKQYNAPFDKEQSLSGYANNQSKNILWKVETPGWSTSTPVPVGKHVITLHSPHYVVCRDTDTGKVIWQDELKVMTLPKLAKDRKNLEPVAANAAQLQRLHEMAVAAYRVARGCQPTLGQTRMTGAQVQPLTNYHEAFVVGMTEFRKHVVTEFPEGVAALDKDIALGRKIQEMAKTGSQEQIGAVPVEFATWAMKQTGVPVGNCWPGWQISDTIATPVSDGEFVAVQFGHGQTAAYEVATGRRLWAFRDPTVVATSVSHAPSPLLWKDLVIFNAGGGAIPGRKQANLPSLLAVDKRTGKPRWETPIPDGCVFGGSHGDHMPHYLFRLPGDKAVIAGNRGQVVDAEIGAVLTMLPSTLRSGSWGAGFIAGLDNRLFKAMAADNYAPPMEVWQLQPTGDKLKVVSLTSVPFCNGQKPFALSDRALVVFPFLVDPQTGVVLDSLPNNYHPIVSIAGNVLLEAKDNGADPRARQDRLNLLQVFTYDITDTTDAVPLSRRNLLGNSAMPRDILDTYFPNIGNNPDLKDYLLGGYHGLAAGFGVYMCGIQAQGNRLFILSQTHLYCIGPEVLGSPQDNPSVVAQITTANDAGVLGKFLDAERPRYRYEALRRWAALKLPAGKRVAELVEQDPFEEIRAAAVLALDAAGENGGELFLARYLTTQQALTPGQDKMESIGPYWLTARVLGADYFRTRIAKVVVAEKDTGSNDLVNRASLTVLASHVGLFTPEITASAVEMLKVGKMTAQQERLWIDLLNYLGRAARNDPSAQAALRKAQGRWVGYAIPVLANRLPVDQLPGYLDEALRSGGSLGYNWSSTHESTPIMRICKRMGPGKAVPILEKVAADKPDLAKQLQGLIEKIKTDKPNPTFATGRLK